MAVQALRNVKKRTKIFKAKTEGGDAETSVAENSLLPDSNLKPTVIVASAMAAGSSRRPYSNAAGQGQTRLGLYHRAEPMIKSFAYIELFFYDLR